ncbi:hypothetical protein DYB32_010564, partial [Aphanomyces invadans]
MDGALGSPMSQRSFEAPEILKENDYTVAADMYSFGMVVTELDSHEIPYTNLTNGKGKPLVDTAIMSMVMHGDDIHPALTAQCPTWIKDLALQYLAIDPANRPTAIQVAAVTGPFDVTMATVRGNMPLQLWLRCANTDAKW